MNVYGWTNAALVRGENAQGCDVGLSGVPRALKLAKIDLTTFVVPFNDTAKIDFVLNEIKSFTRGTITHIK